MVISIARITLEKLRNKKNVSNSKREFPAQNEQILFPHCNKLRIKAQLKTETGKIFMVGWYTVCLYLTRTMSLPSTLLYFYLWHFAVAVFYNLHILVYNLSPLKLSVIFCLCTVWICFSFALCFKSIIVVDLIQWIFKHISCLSWQKQIIDWLRWEPGVYCLTN